jgi:hypothetical protein
MINVQNFNRNSWKKVMNMRFVSYVIYLRTLTPLSSTPWKRMGDWRYSSTTHDIGTRCRHVASFTSRHLYGQGKSPRSPKYWKNPALKQGDIIITATSFHILRAICSVNIMDPVEIKTAPFFLPLFQPFLFSLSICISIKSATFYGKFLTVVIYD